MSVVAAQQRFSNSGLYEQFDHNVTVNITIIVNVVILY